MPISIERPSVVQRRAGVSRSRMYTLIAEGKFPKQIVLGPKSVGFMSDEVDKWIEDRRRDRDEQRDHICRAEASQVMRALRSKAQCTSESVEGYEQIKNKGAA